MSRAWAYGLLALVLALTVIAYWHGLQGPFLFDDYPNLKPLGELDGVRDWTTLKAYALNGFSGPTGRPISLLSFLINDNAWPSVAWGFKLTNLQLHLICGLLITWATYLLLQAAQWQDTDALFTAVLAASFWMLHPFLVSTTLYVVQRMAMLSTLFMLVGIVGYLKGRLWLMNERKPQSHAYILMSASLIIGTLLGVLSKENGALLPMLVLVIEIFLWRTSGNTQRPNNWWISLFLGLPTLAIIAYLLRAIDFSPNPWPGRTFNQIERLYSEARIFWDYLYQLWIPRIEGSGLFQDGFTVSRSLTEPLSTLWAVLGLVALLGILPLLYRRLPLVWLALTFFICGHLIESTVLGLELHFEHRNYAPSLFMFLPLAAGIQRIHLRERVKAAIILALIAMLFTLTWQRALLWSDEQRLQTYWALNDPQSARGRNFMISHLVDEKRYAEALVLAEQAIHDLPNSSLLTMAWLRINVNTNQATPEYFSKAAQMLVNQPFDAQTVAGLRTLVDDVSSVDSLEQYRRLTLQLTAYLNTHGPYKQFPLFMRINAYNQARLYRSLGEIQAAYEHYLLAMDRYRQANSALQMFAEVANAGYEHEAMQLLDHIEREVAADNYDVYPLGKATYQQEIARVRRILQDSIEAQQKQQPQN